MSAEPAETMTLNGPFEEGTTTSPLEPHVVAALRGVYDPEIPVNIFDLGLIYDVAFPMDGIVDVKMTLTAPGCPVAEEMPGMVSEAIRPVEGVDDVRVEIVWDPPWRPDFMSEAARLELGMF
ncbi:DUF59 domain-containing protein [Oceanibacterium hippocampi]|uniref:Putative 1,2-phenylacetyl-CoA epoxidase, subunit D n=1 Tax=Oceanibacterium hippocampi TaxID=745714 RepID=A0A1Y5TD24_9PROT|nr:DUF59 domain-containing protein [Oceanibacterium hippocampi]SLN57631.1 Putative 1,2-phenylacetyl-CoA epoxidase, subunit D [Oceanibacterium hippocampi]